MTSLPTGSLSVREMRDGNLVRQCRINLNCTNGTAHSTKQEIIRVCDYIIEIHNSYSMCTFSSRKICVVIIEK